jgi:hypothetical protein
MIDIYYFSCFSFSMGILRLIMGGFLPTLQATGWEISGT